MVNLLVNWLWVPFCTRSRIPLRVLFGFRGIGFRIPLRVLSGFWVPPGLVVPSYPLLVPVFWSFELSISFVVALIYLGLVALWCHIGWYFVTYSAKLFCPSSQNMCKWFFRFFLWPSKISCLLLKIFLFFRSVDYAVFRCIVWCLRCWWLLVDLFR